MKNFKNYILLFVVVLCSVFCGYCEASAKTTGTGNTANTANKTGTANKANTACQARKDKQVIREYVKRKYGKGYKLVIRPAMKTSDKELACRKGKKRVYVDILHTISDGKKGGRVIDKGSFYGSYTNYARRERKNKHITVYLIYNPNSSYTDDIIAIVNNGKLKD